MQPPRPGLARSLLKGTFWHFLTAVVIPVLLIGGGSRYSLRREGVRDPGGAALVVGTYFSLILGAIFLFHELVLLGTVALRQRRWRVPPPEPDLKVDAATDLLLTVISTDLATTMLFFAWLVWRMNKEAPRVLSDWFPYLFLPCVGLYGVHLFGRCVREALAVPPASPQTKASKVPPTRRATDVLFGREMPGLQMYVTAATAWLAFCLVGWPKDWGGVFGIALISSVVGRGAVWLAVECRRTGAGEKTWP